MKLAMVCTALVLGGVSAKGDDIIFVSGNIGGRTDLLPTSVWNNAFSGVRFTVPAEKPIVTHVGANLEMKDGYDGSFFIAIVRLDSPTGLPHKDGSSPFTLSEVVASRAITIPTGVISPKDYRFELEATLVPGVTYGLVFGTGQFGDPGNTLGANAGTSISRTNTDIGSPSYFGYTSGSWGNLSTPGYKRFWVEAIPEPGTAVSLGCGAMFLFGRRRRYA